MGDDVTGPGQGAETRRRWADAQMAYSDSHGRSAQGSAEPDNQAGGGIDSRVRAAASSRLGQLSDVPGLVGSDHPRCGKPHRDSCRQAALLCLAHRTCGDADLWDMCWLASRSDVDSRRAMELAELKSSDYGEEGLWADRADRVAGVARCDRLGCLRRRDAPVPPRRPDDIHGRIPTLERMGDRTDRDVVRHSRHSIVGRCGSRIPYFRCVERLQSNPLNAKEVCDVESGL